MCEEKHVSTKVCACCGNAKTGNGNPELAKFSPRELIEELRCRGYHGKLEYVQRHEINI